MKQCLGFTSDGSRCKRRTSHPSGFCADHRWMVDGGQIMRCDQCFLRESCEHYGEAPDGLCYFELYGSQIDLGERAGVEDMFREVIRGELLVYRRLLRLQSAFSPEDPRYSLIANLLGKFGDRVFSHGETFARFLGIDDIDKLNRKKEQKIKLLLRIFEKEETISEDDPITKEEEEIIISSKVGSDEEDNL